MTGGGGTFLEFGLGEVVITPEEMRRLEELDSKMFGFVNLQAPEMFRERVLVIKAVKVLEKQLLDYQQEKSVDSGATAEISNRTCAECRIYLKLGHLHLLCFDFAKAMSAYQRVCAIEKNCLDPAFLYGLGLTYFHFRAYELALKTFQRVLYVSPCFSRTSEIHLRLGQIYEALEDWELALKFFNCALVDSSPCSLSKSEIRFRIAHCYDQRGDLKRAKDFYESILNDQHNHPLTDRVKAAIFRQLGWIIYRAEFLPEDRTHRLQQAVGWLTESLKLDSNSGNTYYYLGRCYSAIPGRAHDAFVNYRHSIDKSEASADTWCSIGVLYQQQQQPMDALQAFVCAVQLDGNHPAAWTDLGLLYESNFQFQDACNCLKKASEYKPPNPEALKVRIDFYEKELRRAPIKPLTFQGPEKRLPSLEEAWKLPIPAELSQRQEGFLKQKQDRYIQGSPLLSMGALSAELESGSGAGPNPKAPPPPFYLTGQQIQMMHVLQQSQPQLDPGQIEVLRNYQNNFALMQQHIKFVQQQRNLATEEFLLGESSDEGTKDGLLMSEADPMLNETKDSGSREGRGDGESTSGTPAAVRVAPTGSEGSEGGPPTGLQDNMVTSSSESRTEQDLGSKFGRPSVMGNIHINAGGSCQALGLGGVAGGSVHSTGQPLPPPPMNLMSQVYVSTSNTSGKDVISAAKHRSQNPATYKPVFEEHCPPPVPPPRPSEKLPKEKLLISTPSVIVDSKKDAFAPELQSFCYKQPLVLIKGMTAALRMDLSLFSTKTLVETAPDQQVEVRTQPKMPPDKNFDQFGTATWRFESTRSFTTVAKYAQYQAQTFQHAFKEEQEKVKSGGNCSGKNSGAPGEPDQPQGKRGRRDSQGQYMLGGQPEDSSSTGSSSNRYQILKFGTNVDLSDEKRWRLQLQELTKLPPFLRMLAACDMLSHLGHTVFGMNTVQLYMKGWCNNIAWNVASVTGLTFQLALERYEWNKLMSYKSIVPMQHLSWQLTRNINFTSVDLYELIKKCLIRSLAYTQMTKDFVENCGKQVKYHPRLKNEVVHYCAICEVEVFNFLFVVEQSGKYVVHCVDCSRRIDSHLRPFTVLHQWNMDDLVATFDACVLNQVKDYQASFHVGNYLCLVGLCAFSTQRFEAFDVSNLAYTDDYCVTVIQGLSLIIDSYFL